MAQEVLIHIGSHKTGTTSFQKMMDRYHDGYTAYADFGDSNHSIAFTTMFSKKPHDYHIWKRAGFSKRLVKQKQKMFFNQLDNEISRKDCQRILFSGEGIRLLGSKEKELLLDYFQSKEVKVTLVYVAREPMGFAKSYSQQLIKRGIKKISPISLGHILSLRTFVRLLPRGRIRVFDYDSLVDHYGDSATGLARELGLKIDTGSRYLNQSMSKSATQLVYLLNKHRLISEGNPNKLRARRLALSRIVEIFPNTDSDQLDPKMLVHALGSESHLDAQFLQENFGINHRNQLPSQLINKKAELYLGEIDNETFTKFISHHKPITNRKFGLGNVYVETMGTFYRQIYRDVLRKISN